MSWAVGYDTTWDRDIGYGVPAKCDQPGCDADIDRGLGYACGDVVVGGEQGCGLFFCAEHGGGAEECSHPDSLHAKPDVAEWIEHKLTDPSWKRWRDEHPSELRGLDRQLIAARIGALRTKTGRTGYEEGWNDALDLAEQIARGETVVDA